MYIDSFRICYIPQDVLSKLKDKSIINSICRIQSDDSFMYGFYCIALIKFMIAGKTLLDYTNLFSPNDDKENDNIICKYFKDKYGKRKRPS